MASVTLAPWREVGGYLAFLLPALMGLFAQVGGLEDPLVWRLSFILIAVVGLAATGRMLAADGAAGVGSIRAGTAGVYAVVAALGAFPGLADVVKLRAIQVEALLLVLLVALGHALVWHFFVHDSIGDEAPERSTPPHD